MDSDTGFFDTGMDWKSLLSSPEACQSWLTTAGVHDTTRGTANLTSILGARVSDDVLQQMIDQLRVILPGLSDPDMALNNFDRFFSTLRNRLSWAALCERDATVLPVLLQMFSTSQHLSDRIIRNPSLFDVMRKSQGAAVAKAVLVDELATEIESVHDDQRAMGLINAFKQRQLARIIYGDITLGQRLSTVTRQISYVADVICEVTLRFATRQMTARYGMARNVAGERAEFVVLALGKLGGLELNYSSDIDLLFVYGQDGQTNGARSIGNAEYFERLAKRLVQMLTLPTVHGTAYRVDLRLRPEGSQGAAVISRMAALRYYENAGRTWERQAFLKMRPIAGDIAMGERLQQELEPWIYGRNLTSADMAGIKALKRKIESSARREGDDRLDVKVGHGGIRDIEFSIQLLQLLMGGEFPEVRTGNTLDAISRLEQVNGLSMQERSLLERHYVFLRKIEHRLQIMFDTQTHRIPEDAFEQRRLALRMGYADQPPGTALTKFQHDLQKRTGINRRILDHLLHNAVGEDADVAPERDLILDPSPDSELMETTLARYGFADTMQAHKLLKELATEQILFLSKRRCRHFLASIAPRLLTEVASTPHPDGTLMSLAKVSDSLGGKGVLWELFSQSEPCLKLYVRLCAACDYLAEVLTTNPGMLDELMDSLLMDRLPTMATLESVLDELCRNAEDIEPILASFKHAQHLRVGARDIVGKENIRTTTAALADVAEVCLRRVASHQYETMLPRYGVPLRNRDGQPCELIILAAGKMGGREPNYHSDVDVIFLYEDVGETDPSQYPGATSTTNQHFFSELGQRIIKMISTPGPYGMLFSIDARLRPTGRSGPMAVSTDEFRKYFASGFGQLWERLALCKARPIYGSAVARAAAQTLLHDVISQPAWNPGDVQDIYDMRIQLQETAAPYNLKRGPGGTVDVEFVLQMLQMRWSVNDPSLLQTNVWQAIDTLHAAGLLSTEVAEESRRNYELLRNVEARLRLMNTTARHEFPEDPLDARKLAYLLRTDPIELRSACQSAMRRNRELFLTFVAEAKS